MTDIRNILRRADTNGSVKPVRNVEHIYGEVEQALREVKRLPDPTPPPTLDEIGAMVADKFSGSIKSAAEQVLREVDEAALILERRAAELREHGKMTVEAMYTRAYDTAQMIRDSTNMADGFASLHGNLVAQAKAMISENTKTVDGDKKTDDNSPTVENTGA